MKKFKVLSFVLLLMLPWQAQAQEAKRAMFVSVIENSPVLTSKKQIIQLIDFSKKAKIQTLFVQIYRANKAWFPSQVGDATPYLECFKKVGEDPFALLIKEAHLVGIKVHAWINLLSLSANTEAPILKKYGPSILTKNLKPKKTLEDYKIDHQYFLEPSDLRVRQQLLKLVDEILQTYPNLDGLQFDYIRYPDSNPFYGYSTINMENFQKATGSKVVNENIPAWKDWRRGQVTDLLTALVGRARKINPVLKVTTTGCATFFRAYHEAFQDWPAWVNTGLTDFVTVMTYPDNVKDFKEYLADAKKRLKDPTKLDVAVPAYKLVKRPRIFAEQWQTCLKENQGACVVFYYGNILDAPALGNTLLEN